MKKIYKKTRKVFLTIIALMAAFRHTVMRRRSRRAVVNAFVLALMCTVIFGGLTYHVLSFEPGENEILEAGENGEEADKESGNQTGDDAEATEKADAMKNAEGTDKAEISKEAENMNKTETAKEAETVDEAETSKEAETADKAETAKEPETADKADAVKEKESEDKADFIKEKSSKDEPETADKTQTSKDSLVKVNKSDMSDESIYEDEIIAKSDSDENKDFDITAVGYEGVYDGGEHSIAVEVNDSVDGVSIEYSENAEGPFGDELPFYLDVGTYTVYYKVSAVGYNTLTGSENVVITKRTLLITPLADQKKEYGAVDVKPYQFEMEGLVPLDIIDGEIGREEGEEVGSYHFTTGTLEHEDYEFVLSDEAPVYNIVGKPLVASMITQDTLEYNYDGGEHSPLVSVKDGDKEMEEGVDYTLTGATKATDPGEYLMFVQGVGNYAGYVALEYKIVGDKKENAEQSGGDSGVNKPEESKAQDSSSGETSKGDNTTTDTPKTIDVTEINPGNAANMSGNQDNNQSGNANDTAHQVVVETSKGEKTVSLTKTTKKNSETKSASKVSNDSDTKALSKDNEDNAGPVKVAGGSDSVKTGDEVPIGVIWYLMFNAFFVVFLLMGSADAYQEN